MKTAIVIEAEVTYEGFVLRERSYYFELSTDEEKDACVERIVAYLDKHPDTPLQTLCKDIAGDGWEALRGKVQRAREKLKAQVDEPETRTRTLPSDRIRQARSAIKRAPAEVIDALSDEDVDAVQAAIVDRKLAPKPEPKPKAKPAGTITLYTHEGTPVEYPKYKGAAKFNQTPGEGISWAAWSWNPVTGCLHGCDYCYARDIATGERMKETYPVGFTPLFHRERLDAPRNTSIPAQHRKDPAWSRVFVGSMTDLYGRWVPDEWVAAVHESMVASPEWQYLLLTKFPARYLKVDLPPRAWVGTSIDEQKRVRIAEETFAQIEGVAVKWLSLEPLLAPLEFSDLSMFDWVVIGAQTATQQPTGAVAEFAPPFEWVVRIIDQAREAGVPVHCKPNLLGRVGPQLPGMHLPDEYPAAFGKVRR